MRASSSVVMALALLGAAPAPPHVYVGVQALLAAGAHTDVAGTQRGVAGGALLQFGIRGKRVGMHLEGIPPVSLPQAPSAYYGQATPQLSLINGAVQFAVDPHARWWAGVGETIVNQRTPLPNLSQVVTSRLSGVRYEASYRVPLSGAQFFEVVAGAAPHLSGMDRYTYSIRHPEVDKPEVAAEEDAMIAYGLTRGDTQWLAGIRTINFSARYVATGEAADRNNGAGLVLEWRQFVR